MPLVFFCKMTAKEAEILGKYLPENSVSYCYQLWKEHSIQFKITRPRRSIYGNYCFKNGAHHITVNGNLNKSSFLVTYLHEVAHLLTRKRFGNRVKPHGEEWKKAFAELMQPVLQSDIFPEPVLKALKRHLKNPSATSCSDPELFALLRDETFSEGMKKAGECIRGEQFRFQDKYYEWIRSIRTRCEIRSLENGRLYRISSMALVEVNPEGKLSETTEKSETGTLLRRLPEGQRFRLEDRIFRKIELRRTRVLCEEIPGKGRYLISGNTEIPKDSLIADPSV